MLILVLALHAAAVAAPPADLQQRHPKRSVVRAARRGRVRTVAMKPVLAPCRAGSLLSRCARPDPNDRYRVAETDDRIDFKTRIVERGTFRNCGVTGMPVCPTKGMPILHSETN